MKNAPNAESSFIHEIAMPAMLSSPYVLPILMLLGSNI